MFRHYMRLCGLCFLFFILPLSRAQTGEDAVNLHRFLFNTTVYNKRVRPIRNQTESVQVRLAFGLSAIQELDSFAQTISVGGIPFVSWRDEFLTWDETQFGGLTNIHVFQDEIWRPQISPISAVGSVEEIGDSFMTVRITDSGQVSWAPPGAFKVICTVDIRFYPFDTQTCTLDFAASGFTTTELTLISTLLHADLEYFKENVEWELLSTKSKVYKVQMQGAEAQIFSIALELKRRTTFIMIHSVAPLILLSSLNILVFALPAESGEKVSLSITLFLAFAIFLTMLSESLPKNSLTLPIFSVYLIFINVLNTLYVILTVVILKIYHFPTEKPVPAFLQSFVARRLCCLCKVGHHDDDDNVLKVDQNACQHESKSTVTAPGSSRRVKWIDVSKALDKVFMWIFSFIIVLSSMIFGIFILKGR